MVEHATKRITEGKTVLVVPEYSLGGQAPPRGPVFFNPRARLNRDISVLAYAAFARRLKGEALFLDCQSGLGARGLRAACEARIDHIILNDLNPLALKLATESARLNSLDGMEYSTKETCVFLAAHSRGGERGAIVDIDPFGSPAPFLDCCMRAVIHGGMLSVTATDLQVLGGIFPDACKRRYGGYPAKSAFGNETALRLLVGCMRSIASRLDLQILPLLVHSDLHYYRVYAEVRRHTDTSQNMGYLCICEGCGRRGASSYTSDLCECGANQKCAGPLWTGNLFDAGFARQMTGLVQGMAVASSCRNILERAASEAQMPATYYTLDEVASMERRAPPRLALVIERLRRAGFAASPTSLNSSGFRTDAPSKDVREIIF